jgi:hypothetical protein
MTAQHMKITDNYVTVDRAQVDVYQAIHWAKQHCPHYITNDYHAGPELGLVDFFFLRGSEAQREMIWFVMRWS